MIKVQFNDVDEWFGELDKTELLDDIVRVSVMQRPSQQFPGVMFFVSVVATAVNGAGQIIELLVPCGDYMRHMMVGDGPPAIKKANEMAADIRRRLEEVDLDVRDGRFLTAEATNA